MDTGTSDDGLRFRKTNVTSKDNNDQATTPKVKEELLPLQCFKSGTYWLTRIVFLRSLGFVYAIAFLVALRQNRGLIGRNGLLPAHQYLERVRENNCKGGLWECISLVPTILWLPGLDWTQLDWLLDLIAGLGLALSAFVTIAGCANAFIMLAIWVLYHSIINVGQKWYSFGWESQLLETGFLAVFLCPVLSLQPTPRHTPTPWVTVCAYRWLIFRIMFGAGMIKIRGDQCWRDLTCMNYHYQTQPVPNPISYYLHQLPEWWHQAETAANHFVELVACFFVLVPWRPITFLGGVIQILFQVVLIISGNLSFLNWLTMLPCIFCLDDKFLSPLFSKSPASIGHRVLQIQKEDQSPTSSAKPWGTYVRSVANVMLGLSLAYLSIPVVQNILSSKQLMNTSFDSLRLVNTYGAFGSVTKERHEIIMKGTLSENPQAPEAVWLEYQFHCKPGNLTRRPCFISPYHYRLDWLMWFVPFQGYAYNPWLLHMTAKLLVNDELVTSLIAYNPFENGPPPKFIKADRYLYTYTDISADNNRAWWNRKKLEQFLRPVSLQQLTSLLRKSGFEVPKVRGQKAPKKN